MRTPVAVAFLGILAWPLQADVVLWKNGPLINGPGAGANGAGISAIQGELGLTSIGFGGAATFPSSSTWRELADDFVIETPGGWQVSAVTVYTMPFNPTQPPPSQTVLVAIFLGPPWDGGVNVFSGNTTSSTPLGAYRVPGNEPASTEYPIAVSTLPVGVLLPPGHYWLRWEYAGPVFGFRSQSPPVTVKGATSTGDARYRGGGCASGAGCWTFPWTPVVDSGTDTPQGLPFVITGRPVSARKGDFDGLYGPDLIFRNVNPQSPDFNRNKVWFMDGVARAGEAFVTPDPDGPQWVVVGADDFDTAGAPANGPDAKTDLVLRDTTTGDLQFWLLDGTARVGPPLPLAGAAPLPPEWKLSATADFDRDGRPDLVFRNEATQKLRIWTMSANARTGEIVPAPDQAVDANWAIVAAQDYNADGHTDFLWYNATSGRIVTWYMDAAVQRVSGQFVNPPAAGDNNWRVLAGGDYSGAAGPGTPPLHAPDIVWRNETSGRMVVWHLDAASNRVFGEFTSPAAETPALDWTVAGPR